MIDRVFNEQAVDKIEDNVNQAKKMAKRNPRDAFNRLSQINQEDKAPWGKNFKGYPFSLYHDAKVHHMNLNHLTTDNINRLGSDLQDQKLQNDASYADFTKDGNTSYTQRLKYNQQDLHDLKGFKKSLGKVDIASPVDKSTRKYLEDHPNLKTRLNLKVNRAPKKLSFDEKLDYELKGLKPSKKPRIEDRTTGDTLYKDDLADKIKFAQKEMPKNMKELRTDIKSRQIQHRLSKVLNKHPQLQNKLHVATGETLGNLKKHHANVRVVQSDDPEKIGWRPIVQRGVLYRRDATNDSVIKNLGHSFDGAKDIKGNIMTRPLLPKETKAVNHKMNLLKPRLNHQRNHSFKKLQSTYKNHQSPLAKRHLSFHSQKTDPKSVVRNHGISRN